jgi:hypothetical protein
MGGQKVKHGGETSTPRFLTILLPVSQVHGLARQFASF